MYIISFLLISTISLVAMLPEVPTPHSSVLHSISLEPTYQSTHITKPDSIEFHEDYRAHSTKKRDTFKAIQELQLVLQNTAKSQFKLEDIQQALSTIQILHKKRHFHFKSWYRHYPTMMASIQLIIDFEKHNNRSEEFSTRTMNTLLNCYTVKESLRQTDRLLHL